MNRTTTQHESPAKARPPDGRARDRRLRNIKERRLRYLWDTGRLDGAVFKIGWMLHARRADLDRALRASPDA